MFLVKKSLQNPQQISHKFSNENSTSPETLSPHHDLPLHLVRAFLPHIPLSQLWLCTTETLEDPNVTANCVGVGVGEEKLIKQGQKSSQTPSPIPAESQPEMYLSRGGEKWTIRQNPDVGCFTKMDIFII